MASVYPLYDSFNQTEVGYCGARLSSPGNVCASFPSYFNTKMILKETAEDWSLTVIQTTFHFLI